MKNNTQPPDNPIPIITKFMENIDNNGYISSIDPASDTPDVKITRVYGFKPIYSDKVSGIDGVAIGNPALYLNNETLLGGCNNVILGIDAGLHLTTESNKVIIGDGIKSMDKSQPNVLFIGENVAIGKTLFGKPINLFDIITEYYNATRYQESL